MKLLVLCTLFLALACALPYEQNEPPIKRLYVDTEIEGLPKDVGPRITSGEEVVPHSIPYQAYLIISTQSTGRWACGGSLISPTHVLTAAHCLDDAISAEVYLGAHNITRWEASQVIVESQNFIIHENYSVTDIVNDIGVIVLDEPVELSENISTVALPFRVDTVNYTGANARISGWGRVSGVDDVSSVLMQANATVVTNAFCQTIYPIVIDSHLCTFGSNGEGSCSGDSGGPLVAGNFQIGIVSFGASGCGPYFPSAFTRITSYLDWINENTGLPF